MASWSAGVKGRRCSREVISSTPGSSLGGRRGRSAARPYGRSIAATPRLPTCLTHRPFGVEALRYRFEIVSHYARSATSSATGCSPSNGSAAQEIHRLIGQVHPAIAAAMHHVDTGTEPRLERILSE